MNTIKSKIKIKKLDNQIYEDEFAIPQMQNFVWLIIGAKGSGKSNIIINALNNKKKNNGLKKRFQKIYMCSPTAIYDPKYEKLHKELDEGNTYYNTLNNKILSKIYDDIINNHSDKHNSLLILDDCISMLPKSTEKNSILNKIIACHRHIHLSIIISSQKYNSINTLIRNNYDILSIFKIDNKSEYKTIENDLNTNAELLKEVYDFAVSKKHSFLHIRLSNPILFYQNFDKIIL